MQNPLRSREKLIAHYKNKLLFSDYKYNHEQIFLKGFVLELQLNEQNHARLLLDKMNRERSKRCQKKFSPEEWKQNEAKRKQKEAKHQA